MENWWNTSTRESIQKFSIKTSPFFSLAPTGIKWKIFGPYFPLSSMKIMKLVHGAELFLWVSESFPFFQDFLSFFPGVCKIFSITQNGNKLKINIELALTLCMCERASSSKNVNFCEASKHTKIQNKEKRFEKWACASAYKNRWPTSRTSEPSIAIANQRGPSRFHHPTLVFPESILGNIASRRQIFEYVRW